MNTDRPSQVVRDFDRRETLTALCVVIATAALGVGGVKGLAVGLPGLLIPTLMFALFGHMVGRKAGSICVMMGLVGAVVSTGTDASSTLLDWGLILGLALTTWVVSSRIELARVGEPVAQPIPLGQWWSIEIEFPASIPLARAICKPSDLHVKIVQQRRKIALTRRA